MWADVGSWTTHQARSRAIVKTLCYRILMILITIAISLAVVGDIAEATSIGLAANIVKTGTYYGYERLWNRITWGVRASTRMDD